MANIRPITIQSGDFKQQQDADTLIAGAGVTTADGNLTISSAGGLTTLSDATVAVTNAATVGSTITVTGAVNANGGVQRSTSGGLSIGTDANTTSLTVGSVGVMTTIAGDFTVNGTEAVVGTTEFTAGVTFKGTVTVGDGTGADTLSFNATSGRIGGDVSFVKEANHTLNVDASTTATTAGANLTIAAGAGNGAVGGNLVITSGAGASAADGSVTIDSGGGDGAGGAITIGATDAASVGIGRSGISTTFAGTVDLTGATTNLGTGAEVEIEGVALDANFTAANINTLLDGSNADALHTHAAASGANLVQAGLTLFSTPVAGELGYVSADDTVARCIATSMAAARMFGVYDGTAATATVGGVVDMLFVSGLTSIVAGSPVFISEATAGSVTKTAPSTATQVVAEVGILQSGSGYNDGAGSAHPVLIQVKPPVLL